MIEFYFETPCKLTNASEIKIWIGDIIVSEGFEIGQIDYIFCDDDYLLKINKEFLSHDTLTDIISFDYKLGKQINGEIYISVERVKDNAIDFNTSFECELHRVMIHGIFHFCGYKDKTPSEQNQMRTKEDLALEILNFK